MHEAIAHLRREKVSAFTEGRGEGGVRRQKAQVSVAAVARRAAVSRTFLYGNSEARTAVTTAMTEADERESRTLVEQDDEREATWRERVLNAEEALKAVQADARH